MTRTRRTGMYALLAELLAEPPDWITYSGRDWPLFGLLTELASVSDEMHQNLDILAGIPSESLDQRRERYTSLFASGKPRFWLYESAAKTGKILGPYTFEIAQLYRAAGLEAAGAELPDHISLELKFLSHLVEQIDDFSYEQQFLTKHGDWMIELGCALQQSGDTVYGPIGALLADWLTEQKHHINPNLKQAVYNLFVPFLPKPDDCTLCGFCAQICPTHALRVMEDAGSDLLSLNPAECINCGKCERICGFQALKMSLPVPEIGKSVILRQSPHVKCQTCGRAIASQAEMDYIFSKIGEAAWQDLCLDCRTGLYI